MATRPNKGPVQSIGTAVNTFGTPAKPKPPASTAGRYKNGSWRPNTNFKGSFGVRMVMRHEPGITKGDVLRVPMRFQAPALNDLSRSFQFNWATFDTVRAGQGSRPQGRQLLQLQVNTMLLDAPAMDSSTGAVIWPGAPDPQQVINELRWIMGDWPGAQPEIFRLVLSQPAVWGSTALVNELATIITLEPVQHQDEVGTEYVGITFQRFPQDENVARKQRPQSHGAGRWTLHRGDTLYEIAKKSHFHQPSAWKTIAKANGIKGVSPNSATELAGWAKRHHKTQLKIPAKGRR